MAGGTDTSRVPKPTGIGYRSMFIRVVFDDPEERYTTETDLRKAMVDHVSKFAGVNGCTVEMRP